MFNIILLSPNPSPSKDNDLHSLYPKSREKYNESGFHYSKEEGDVIHKTTQYSFSRENMHVLSFLMWEELQESMMRKVGIFETYVNLNYITYGH